LPEWNAVVLNRCSPLIQWICRLADAAADAGRSVSSDQVAPFGDLLSTPCSILGHECAKLDEYVKAWRASNVDDDLRPPDIEIKKSQFFPPVLRAAGE
jgi:hypothetical protein